jgi:beta-lactamase regulating signal transducer with metallopeptidase domain
MNTLNLALVWCVFQVTLLASAAALAYVIVRRFGPAAGALAALAGLILCASLAVFAYSPWPRWQFSSTQPASTNLESIERAAISSARNPDESVEVADEALSGTDGREYRTSTFSQTAAFFDAFVSEFQRRAAPERSGWSWPAYVAIVMLLGLAAGLCRLLLGIVAVRTYRMQARPISDSRIQELADVLLAELRGPSAVTVCESEVLSTPATIGWRKPLVILPADWRDWTLDECRAVLAHEIAHISRCDYATWMAAQLALVFHFYHPLIHWLAARLRLEQELAADAAAARIMGGHRLYLTTLAGMALRGSDKPLAWPARSFLPTRGTLMRRIEMLRDETLRTGEISRWLRIGIVVGLSVIGMGVAGLRGSAADSEPKPKEQVIAKSGDPIQSERRQSPAAPSKSGDSVTSTQTVGSSSTSRTTATEQADTLGHADPESLAWVPRDAMIVVRVRPHDLLSRPTLAPVKKMLQEQKGLQEALGISPEQIDQVTLSFTDVVQQPLRSVEPVAAVVRLVAGADPVAMIKALLPNAMEQEFAGQKYLKASAYDSRVGFQADARTIVVSSREEYLRRIIVAGKAGAAKAGWAGGWREAPAVDVVAFVDAARIRPALDQQAGVPGNPMPAIAPLWRDSTSVLLAVDFAKQLKLSIELSAADEAASSRIAETLKAVATLAKNGLSQARSQASQAGDSHAAMLLRSLDLADDLVDSVNIARTGTKVRATASLDGDTTGTALALFVPAIEAARGAAKQATSMNNLKQLALAMHNYAEANGSFPPAVLLGPDGKTPYSWRVALLPYLEAAPLFEQYRKDEPWDGPNNKQLISRMPAVFRDADAADSTSSSYFVLTGPATIFSGKEGTKFFEILDGTSNTLLIVEAKRDIPWTKPEDIPHDAAKPFPKLGGHERLQFLAATADGAVRAFGDNLKDEILHTLATKAGGEIIDWSQVTKPGR